MHISGTYLPVKSRIPDIDNAIGARRDVEIVSLVVNRPLSGAVYKRVSQSQHKSLRPATREAEVNTNCRTAQRTAVYYVPRVVQVQIEGLGVSEGSQWST